MWKEELLSEIKQCAEQYFKMWSFPFLIWKIQTYKEIEWTDSDQLYTPHPELPTVNILSSLLSNHSFVDCPTIWICVSSLLDSG